jgi:FkbM family methyltransferase
MIDGLEVYKNGMHYRPWTYDKSVITEMPRAYGWLDLEGKVVLDIGGNIGAFSNFAIERGAKEVWAFEPEEENFELLSMNVGGRAKVFRGALISGKDSEIKFYKTTSGKNPGNYSMIPFKGREIVKVPAINFSSVLNELQPEVIKMDCEGAEYDLLKTVLPDSVQEISLEIHLNKREFKECAEKLIALFDTWEMVKAPKYNDKSWHTYGGWRKNSSSATKSLKDSDFKVESNRGFF